MVGIFELYVKNKICYKKNPNSGMEFGFIQLLTKEKKSIPQY
jgi:hypothetical protein